MANLEKRGLVTPGDGAGIGEEPELKGVLMAIETSPLATGPSARPPGQKAPRRWPWMIGLLVLGLVTAGVTLLVTRPGDDKTAVAANSTAPAVSSGDAVIIKAYLDAAAATDRAFSSLTVGPDDAQLPATMAEPLLNYVRHQITDLHSKGIYYEPGGITNTSFRVVERSEERAVLRLCENDKSYGYNGKGQRLAAPGLPGEKRAMEAIALRDSATGVWKISSRYPNDGGRECDGA